MTDPLFIEVSFAGEVVRLGGSEPSSDGLAVSSVGVEGWHGTPAAKVSMTEMQTGDGAHAVPESLVLYSARTVSVGFVASGTTRDAALTALSRLLAAAHRTVRLRVVEATHDTYASGYAQVSVDAGRAGRALTGTLDVVCADPRRYSTEAHRTQLFPSGRAAGGLDFGPGGRGLVFPLSFGEGVGSLQNVASLHNSGTSTAYPTITVTGPVDAGLRLDWGGGSLSYGDAVRGVPLVLDCLTRTASVGGLDTSRRLTSRGFPEVPPGGSVTLSAHMAGDGWATVEWRDTYI